VLAGDGPRRAAVQRETATIGDHVRLVGRVDDADLHSLLAVADWFVHPTLFEGSSIVTLEAMAHGLPVIATRAGGLPDKVRDAETGLLVPPGDAAALGAALVSATSLGGTQMGEAGRRHCEESFGWEAVIDRYLDVYRRAGERRNAPPW